MGDLRSIYARYINEELTLAVASNSADVAKCAKLRIRPVSIHGGLSYQITRTVGQKELHENVTAEDAVRILAEVTGTLFRQVEIKGSAGSLTVMTGKRGTVTVKERKASPDTERERSNDGNNRRKNHVLPEGEPVPFLVELGVMTASGKVVASRYDKFRQINRYLEFVEDIIPSLPRGREISIIDFGCGKSYLTFALYYYLHEVKGLDIRVTGLDLKKDVIENCSELAERFGYDKLSFLHGDIADYTGTDSVDMVVTLHACDTATDYALEKAVRWGARVIFCVPCCQHEVNRQIKDESLKSLLKYGLIRERMSALITDALRADMLEEQGYRTQILEFIDMEHTPKNILIRAVRQAQPMKKTVPAQTDDYRQIIDRMHISPTLYRLLHGDDRGNDI